MFLVSLFSVLRKHFLMCFSEFAVLLFLHVFQNLDHVCVPASHFLNAAHVLSNWWKCFLNLVVIMNWMSLSCFCTFIILYYPACLVFYQYYSFTHRASSHALLFPSHVSLFLVDLVEPEHIRVCVKPLFGYFQILGIFQSLPSHLVLEVSHCSAVINSPALCSS